MKVTVISHDEWCAGAQSCGPPMPVKGHFTIRPVITEHRNLLVSGVDFLPVQDGRTVLHQTVHTPSLYIDKRRALRKEADGLYLHTGTIRELCGRTLVVGGSPNYYHWLVDYLPRLLMARHVKFDQVLINKPSAFQSETLRYLGVNNTVEIGTDESVLCEEAVLPSLLACTTVAHPMVPQLVRSALKPVYGDRKVYLSRQDAASRRIVNEAEMVSVLSRYGFERVVASDLTLREQADMGARSLFAAHGAGMANMLFVPPGGSVFELYTPEHQVTSMAMLARVCGLMHTFIPARNISYGADGNPLLGDWMVDLDAVERAL